MITNTKTILIGSSLGPDCDLLVSSGLSFARTLGAAVEVVHAYSPITTVFASFGSALMTPQIAEGERRGLLKALEAQIKRIGVPAADDAPSAIDGAAAAPSAIRVSAYVAEGPPHRLLVERAYELDAGLIIVGSIQTAKHNWTFSTTTDTIVRQAPCPVLVLRTGTPLVAHHVLAPVDLSVTSRQSIECSLNLLGSLEEPPTFELLFALDPRDSASLRQFRQEQMVRLAEAELKRIAKSFESRGSTFLQRKVRVGGAVPEILAEIQNSHPDLVLIGVRGFGGVERLVLGNVAAQVLRSAPVSILIVPPKAGRRAEAERFHFLEDLDRTYIPDLMHPTSVS